MTKIDIYNVKNLILGLRKEYLKTQDYLKLLRALSDSNDKEVKDFYFTVDEENNLICEVIQNPNTLKGIIRSLRSENSLFPKQTYCECLIGDNCEYIIESDRYNIFIKEGKEYEFYEVATKILDSEFVKHSNFNLITDNRFCYLTISPSGIYVDSKDITIEYTPKDDILNIDCKVDYSMYKSLISYVMSSKINPYDLPNYYRNITANNDLLQKRTKIVSLEDSSLDVYDFNREKAKRMYIKK